MCLRMVDWMLHFLYSMFISFPLLLLLLMHRFSISLCVLLMEQGDVSAVVWHQFTFAHTHTQTTTRWQSGWVDRWGKVHREGGMIWYVVERWQVRARGGMEGEMNWLWIEERLGWLGRKERRRWKRKGNGVSWQGNKAHIRRERVRG